MAVFLDTNILVYAEDADSAGKQAIAAALVAECYLKGEAVISTQVMMEYYNVAVRKLKLEPAFAAQRLRLFAKFRTVSTTPQLVLAATDLHRLHSLSFWDAMILQAAITSGCDTLYSEDFNAGQIVSGVKIVNPFKLTN